MSILDLQCACGKTFREIPVIMLCLSCKNQGETKAYLNGDEHGRAAQRADGEAWLKARIAELQKANSPYATGGADWLQRFMDWRKETGGRDA